MIRVAFQYSHVAGYQPILEAQLAREGVEVVRGVDEAFSWRRRLLWTRDVARQYPDDTLIFLDAWDTVLMGTGEEMRRLADNRLWLAGAKTCWPDAGRAAEYGVKAFTLYPWKYINSNPMMGKGGLIVEAIDWGWERFPLEKDSRVVQDYDVCERFWTNLYLQSPFDIHIDSSCELGQIFLYSAPGELAVERGRIHNLVTDSWPVFLHANGHTTVPEELIEVAL